MNTDSNGFFSFSDRDGCGWKDLRFYMDVPAGRIVPGNWRENKTEIAPGIEVRLHFAESERFLEVSVELKNNSRTEFRCGTWGFQPESIILEHIPEAEAVYLHSDNLRNEKAPFFGCKYPLVSVLPTTPVFFGDTPANASPVLFLGRAGHRKWLMEGALTQNRRRLAWEIAASPEPRKSDVRLRSAFTFNGTDFLVLAPGASETAETMVFGFAEGTPGQLHAVYLDRLLKHHPPRAPIKTFAYCTWNYGRFYNLTQKREEANMKRLAALTPGACYQIDSGYQTAENGSAAVIDVDYETPNPNRPCEACDLWYRDMEKVWDRSRFPDGAEGFVKSCGKYGLKPALWWSPRIAADGMISRDHPDWVLRNRQGIPLNVGHWMLDYSVPDVQSFLEGIIRKIHAWGFQGIKIDFSSWMFDHPEACFRFPSTGTELRWKFLNMARRIMGEDAYLMQGVSVPMGNPFMGIAGLNVIRSGMDIHSGTWEQNRRACCWTVQTALACQNRYTMLNIDSFMGDPAIPAEERRMRVVLSYLTGGTPEFGGMLRKFSPAMRKETGLLFERNDPAMRFECPDDNAFYGFPLPSVIVRRNLPGSPTRRKYGIAASFALFNWNDQEQCLAVPAEFLTAELKEFFTGKRFRKTSVKLSPHSCLCLDVASAD